MIISEIRRKVQKAGKDISTVHIYRIFSALGITPVGARQRPQQYPPDAADRILVHFGLASGAVPPPARIERPVSANGRPASLISLAKIKSLKRKVKA